MVSAASHVNGRFSALTILAMIGEFVNVIVNCSRGIDSLTMNPTTAMLML